MNPTALSYPFLRHEFLQALEDSGSACDTSGWYPVHLSLQNSNQSEEHDPTTSSEAKNAALMPLYVKTHSMGEYVFDHAWANAYHQNGLEYYPKLVTSVPFTPSTGPRVRSAQPLNQEECTQLIDEVLAVAEETGSSSWHFLFPSTEHRRLFNDPRLLQRSGVQYHWHNRDYQHFDDFLASMNSRKRKMVRKERADVAAQGIRVSIELGADISPELWALFYQLYERTYAKRNGSRGYLTEQFFTQIARTMPDQMAMAVAWLDDQPIACALYFFDDETLYGRYWGSAGEFSYLHFELCYYTGIEFAISRGIKRYDAGAQGEHKIVRGFEPIETFSLHWIKHPGFRDAIARFLVEEKGGIAQHIEQATAMLPYKKASQ
ncbi:GNAT family N-acetyltransferase [Porticoccaceae bacterium]|nr:GNAT family N-acetyltransferase [Porticoccaceae bacterium]